MPRGGAAAVRYAIILLFRSAGSPMAMAFIQTNWMLVLVLVLSGGMLVWPLIQRRFSPVKDIGNLVATRLLNSGDAVLLDVREPKEFDGRRLPNAIHMPYSQLGPHGRARQAGDARSSSTATRGPQPHGRRRSSRSRASPTSTS